MPIVLYKTRNTTNQTEPRSHLPLCPKCEMDLRVGGGSAGCGGRRPTTDELNLLPVCWNMLRTCEYQISIFIIFIIFTDLDIPCECLAVAVGVAVAIAAAVVAELESNAPANWRYCSYWSWPTCRSVAQRRPGGAACAAKSPSSPALTAGRADAAFEFHHRDPCD